MSVEGRQAEPFGQAARRQTDGAPRSPRIIGRDDANAFDEKSGNHDDHEGPQEKAVRSKAVGEPPLMLAISVREAIREAIAAFGAGGPIDLASPATPERVYFAVRHQRRVGEPEAVLTKGALER